MTSVLSNTQNHTIFRKQSKDSKDLFFYRASQETGSCPKPFLHPSPDDVSYQRTTQSTMSNKVFNGKHLWEVTDLLIPTLKYSWLKWSCFLGSCLQKEKRAADFWGCWCWGEKKGLQRREKAHPEKAREPGVISFSWYTCVHPHQPKKEYRDVYQSLLFPSNQMQVLEKIDL